jgi:hypothetical protein
LIAESLFRKLKMIKSIRYLALLMIIVMGASSAQAVDDLEINPSDIMRALQPASSARGILFQENMEAVFPLGIIRSTDTPARTADGINTSGSDVDWNMCSSWSDENCASQPGRRIEGSVILGGCINTAEIGCVDSLKITRANGVTEDLEFDGPSVPGVADTPQSNALGIPRSSSRPIYRDSKGNLYIVRATLWIYIGEESGFKPNINLRTDITRVSKEANGAIAAPKVERLPNNITGRGIITVTPTRDECVTFDKGICYKALKANVEEKISLKLRVPKGINGWINGRFVQPSIQIEQLNSTSQVISVSAKPATMPVAGGWVEYSDLPNQFMESWLDSSAFFNKDPSSSYYLVANPSQGDKGFSDYAAWAPYLGEKALATVTNWSFATSFGSGPQCLISGNQIGGVVAANASVYSSKPPTWDAANSTLSYQVASPHNDENGKENVGTYTLAMSLKAIQCLYGQSSLPPSATISIGYGTEVVTVATVTLKSASGWVYFNASGFHYSNPTIKVKFAKSASQSAASTPSKNSTPNASAPPVSQTAPGIKTQWCAKGNAKRKVVGANPICPKGYKKIADPTRR